MIKSIVSFLPDVPWLVWRPNDSCLILHVYVQPNASRTKILGIHDKRLKVCLALPPIDNKANDALVAFFSKFCRLSKAQVKIIAGHVSRKKTIIINSLPSIPEVFVEMLV